MAPNLLASMLKNTGMGPVLVRKGIEFAHSRERLAEAWAGYVPTERDVVVATYLKSGTNWMMQMALQTAWRGGAEFEHIHDLVPWPDSPRRSPVSLDDPASWTGCPTQKRVIKTHADADLVPFRPDARYLVVLRDIREVVVSAYHFALPLLGLVGVVDPEEWLEILTAEFTQENPWVRHLAGWWARRNAPNVCVQFYADMKRDPESAARRVAETMGVELTGDEAATVLRRSHITTMRARQSAFAPIALPWFRPKQLPPMIRRGVAGGSDELYTPAQLAPLVDLCRRDLTARAPDFPLDQFGW